MFRSFCGADTQAMTEKNSVTGQTPRLTNAPFVEFCSWTGRPYCHAEFCSLFQLYKGEMLNVFFFCFCELVGVLWPMPGSVQFFCFFGSVVEIHFWGRTFVYVGLWWFCVLRWCVANVFVLWCGLSLPSVF